MASSQCTRGTHRILELERDGADAVDEAWRLVLERRRPIFWRPPVWGTQPGAIMEWLDSSSPSGGERRWPAGQALFELDSSGPIFILIASGFCVASAKVEAQDIQVLELRGLKILHARHQVRHDRALFPMAGSVRCGAVLSKMIARYCKSMGL